MSKIPTITAILNFHREGEYAVPAIRSFDACCSRAEAIGLSVQRIAVLDTPDQLTAEFVNSSAKVFDCVETVSVADLGEARSVGLNLSKGDFVAFFDGDDLWGCRWLELAHHEASRDPQGHAAYHPELVYYFNEADISGNSIKRTPRTDARSFFFRHVGSESPFFDPRCLYFNNIYTSNTFVARGLYEQFPMLRVDRSRGFGVEDWAWHASTVAAGVPHRTVRGSVHLVRVKAAESLGANNSRLGLLPPLFKYDL